MPASLPPSITGICEMPCCLNRSTASPSLSLASAVMTSCRGMARTEIADAAHLPVRLQEAVLAHPRVIEELGHVVADRVGQHHHHPLAGLHRLAHLERGPHRRAARAAHQEALLPDQLARDPEGVAVVGLDPLVDQAAVEHVGDEVVADALDLVALDLAGAGQDRALGIDADDAHAGRDLLEVPGHAGDGAAGAGGHDHGVEPAAALPPDLLAGAALAVGLGVGGVLVLVEDVRIRG